jgi:transcription elongation factor GreB
MSRAFIKEDASGEEVIVPSRAPLPPGTPNLVTPRGYALLEAELAELMAERERVSSDPRQLAGVQGRIEALEERLSSAQVVELKEAPPGEVSFGATVTVRTATGEERRLTIVGVDEASIPQGRVAFTAPIARALLGHQVGDEVRLETARGEQVLRIVSIE